jgi:hypothetical protein
VGEVFNSAFDRHSTHIIETALHFITLPENKRLVIDALLDWCHGNRGRAIDALHN